MLNISSLYNQFLLFDIFSSISTGLTDALLLIFLLGILFSRTGKIGDALFKGTVGASAAANIYNIVTGGNGNNNNNNNNNKNSDSNNSGDNGKNTPATPSNNNNSGESNSGSDQAGKANSDANSGRNTC